MPSLTDDSSYDPTKVKVRRYPVHEANGAVYVYVAHDARSPAPSDPGLDRDLARLVVLWTQMRERFGAGGPWLFGDWSIADAFFTPVAARVRHYQIDLSAHGDDGTAAAYVAALLAQPHFREWEAAALSSNVD
jgi:glutathione S-transferase